MAATMAATHVVSHPRPVAGIAGRADPAYHRPAVASCLEVSSAAICAGNALTSSAVDGTHGEPAHEPVHDGVCRQNNRAAR